MAVSEVAKYRLSEITDCIELDKIIQESRDNVVRLRLKKLSSNFSKVDNLDLLQYENILQIEENEFFKLSCSQKIEYKRMIESGQLITEQAIKAEESIIKKNNTEQYIYISVGSVILLTGLYLIMKNK